MLNSTHVVHFFSLHTFNWTLLFYTCATRSTSYNYASLFPVSMKHNWDGALIQILCMLILVDQRLNNTCGSNWNYTPMILSRVYELVFANIVPYFVLSFIDRWKENFHCILSPLPLIMNHPPLGRCSNKTCSFAGSCQAFYAADGASTYGKNPLPLKCLCGCFGMQHAARGNGGDLPEKHHTEVCTFSIFCVP